MPLVLMSTQLHNLATETAKSVSRSVMNAADAEMLAAQETALITNKSTMACEVVAMCAKETAIATADVVKVAQKASAAVLAAANAAHMLEELEATHALSIELEVADIVANEALQVAYAALVTMDSASQVAKSKSQETANATEVRRIRLAS